MCNDVSDYNTLMRHLMSLIIFDHFQRPSVVANFKLEEFLRATKSTDGHYVILVSEHKTSASGPAQLALESDQYELFQLFSRR